MSAAIGLALTAAAFIGHFSIAVWLFNRLHALALPRPWIKGLERLLVLAAAGVVLAWAIGWFQTGRLPLGLAGERSTIGHWAWRVYAAICSLAALAAVRCWLVPKLLERSPPALVHNETVRIDVARRIGHRPVSGLEAQLFVSVPGNELLQLAVQRKNLRLAQLPPQLVGLKIAHLSDLHMTGKVGPEYYDVVVDETNALAADIIVITGDILEKEKCLPWIMPTLGRLSARRGKYFILGNHEKRLGDVRPLRKMLVAAGLTDLGGRCERLLIDGAEVLLAGTELPWFGTAPEVDVPCSRQQSESRAFRILLSHTPDQLPWAQAKGFDLMLAGHNHGGQIRLPYLGALITPSWYGFRYAGGVYFEPPTLLHVSRGIGGIHLIRLNCPPELALLTLTSA